MPTSGRMQFDFSGPGGQLEAAKSAAQDAGYVVNGTRELIADDEPPDQWMLEIHFGYDGFEVPEEWPREALDQTVALMKPYDFRLRGHSQGDPMRATFIPD